MQLAIRDAKAFADYAYPALPVSNLIHLYFKIAGQAEFWPIRRDFKSVLWGLTTWW